MIPTPATDGSHSSTPLSHAEEVFIALQALALRSGGGKIPTDSPLALYHATARWIYCGFNLFADIPNAILAGIDKENPHKYTKSDHETYAYLCGRIPQFARTLAEFRDKPERYTLLATWMAKWADGARNEDTATLKKHIVAYIPLDPTTTPVMPPLPENNKECRGLNHPMIARLLISREITNRIELAGANDVDATRQLLEEYIQEFKDGNEVLTHVDFPTYLYDETVEYDSSERDRGLLRGHCLLRGYRCLMTGPSSAISKIRVAAKHSKAEIHGLTEVTSKTIAYACVLVRQALSSTQHWTTLDGIFDYQQFYGFILKILKDEKDSWCKALLAFWNEEVPGLQRKSRKRSNPEPPNDLVEREQELMDDLLALRRQRHRREQEQSLGTRNHHNDATSPTDEVADERTEPESEDSAELSEHQVDERSSATSRSSPDVPGLTPQLSRQKQMHAQLQNKKSVPVARGRGEGITNRGGKRGGKTGRK